MEADLFLISLVPVNFAQGYILLKLGMKFLRYLIVLSLFQTDEMSLKDGKLKFSTSKLRRSVSQSERGFSHRPLHDARMGRGSVTFSDMVTVSGLKLSWDLKRTRVPKVPGSSMNSGPRWDLDGSQTPGGDASSCDLKFVASCVDK